ncbi:MAG: bifunctional methylenetetrahydrofolate dehydrogenase/methenyltetrahydrofolate cyclohydrolase FolD [Sphingobium sp.]
MEAGLIDGKHFAAALQKRIADAVPDFVAKAGRAPCLAVILVGDDPASAVYVRSKGKATMAAGMTSVERRMSAQSSEAELLETVRTLNADAAVDAILVQLPLPAGIDEAKVIAAIDPDKDVDGFHVTNAGRLAIGLEGFVPCTPYGCITLLKNTIGDLSGLNAVVVGRSNIVGKPMAQLLVQENCTVTLAHSHTRDLASVTRQADIVVAAVGRPEMIRGDWIKPGATVIDVGINRVVNAGKPRLTGDVAFEEVRAVAAHITPVPGGVGPMTIACLLRNTLIAAHARAGLPAPTAI